MDLFAWEPTWIEEILISVDLILCRLQDLVTIFQLFHFLQVCLCRVLNGVTFTIAFRVIVLLIIDEIQRMTFDKSVDFFFTAAVIMTFASGHLKDYPRPIGLINIAIDL